jgi:hypothetical protein
LAFLAQFPIHAESAIRPLELPSCYHAAS